MIKLSENAYKRLNELRNKANKKFVRLDVKGGGCAGFKYDWSLEDKIADDDEVVDFEKGKFVVDPASVMYLLGSTIDYKKEVFGSYFTVTNPGSTSSCGCGESVGF